VKVTFHGLLRDRSATTLLILDMFSNYRFPDGEQVLRAARRIAPRIRALKDRVRAARLATIYVNDNLGRWRSDMPQLVEQCAADARTAPIVEALRPDPRDYFIFKPRHSAFYATPLEALLDHLGTRTLILTGVSSHQCVLFTATDAHVHNLDLIVPRDCSGAPSQSDTGLALKYLESTLQADIRPSGELRLGARAGRAHR
jgi:nicotinamidase-related amidase